MTTGTPVSTENRSHSAAGTGLPNAATGITQDTGVLAMAALAMGGVSSHEN